MLGLVVHMHDSWSAAFEGAPEAQNLFQASN
jgi:hypothetical protein